MVHCIIKVWGRAEHFPTCCEHYGTSLNIPQGIRSCCGQTVVVRHGAPFCPPFDPTISPQTFPSPPPSQLPFYFSRIGAVFFKHRGATLFAWRCYVFEHKDAILSGEAHVLQGCKFYLTLSQGLPWTVTRSSLHGRKVYLTRSQGLAYRVARSRTAR